MARLFCLTELIGFAIEKEKESYALYKQLTEQTKNKQAKDLFYEIMLQEEHHKVFYENLLNSSMHLEGSVSQDKYTKIDEEYYDYMKDLITSSRTALFPEVVDDVKDAIDYAVAREKDSILFYIGLKNYVPQHEQKGVDMIIREESKHVSNLLFLKHYLYG